MLTFDSGLDALEETFVRFNRNEIHTLSQQAERGDTESLYILASLILQDCPSPRFWNEGIRLLEKASLAGHSEAQAMLNGLLMESIPVFSDNRKSEVVDENAHSSEGTSAAIVKNTPHYAPKFIELHKDPKSELLFSGRLIDTRMENIGFILLYLALSLVPAYVVYYINMHWRFYTDGIDYSVHYFSWWRYVVSYSLVAAVINIPVLLALRKHYRSIVIYDGMIFLFTWDNGLRTCIIKRSDVDRIELSRCLVKIFTNYPVFEDHIKALHSPIFGKSKNSLAHALIKAGFTNIKVR